jgi:hypothetical protein
MSTTITARVDEFVRLALADHATDLGRSIGEVARVGLEIAALSVLRRQLEHPRVAAALGDNVMKVRAQVERDLGAKLAELLPGFESKVLGDPTMN